MVQTGTKLMLSKKHIKNKGGGVGHRSGKNNFKSSAFYLQFIPCLCAGKLYVCDSSLCPGGKKSWETPNTAEIFVHTKPAVFSAYCVLGQVLVLASTKVAGAGMESWGWDCPQRQLVPGCAHGQLCSCHGWALLIHEPSAL